MQKLGTYLIIIFIIPAFNGIACYNCFIRLIEHSNIDFHNEGNNEGKIKTQKAYDVIFVYMHIAYI